MKKIEIEIPDGKRTEWVDGVLTLVDDKPAEFKFKVGDKVQVFGFLDPQEITGRISIDCKPFYKLEPSEVISEEFELDPYTEPQDITERIKTFEDACEWCTLNGHHDIVKEYDFIVTDSLIISEPTKDLITYLKLRIITCALNEGWEPNDEEAQRCYAFVLDDGDIVTNEYGKGRFAYDSAIKLTLKSQKLALYAATQFKDIYKDFCYKGKE